MLHLIGCKKMQQQLCRPGVLEELFEGDRAKAAELRQCFVPMYPADAVMAEASLEDVRNSVLNDPLQFVLKPQREGGGYNIWGDAIVETLRRNDPCVWGRGVRRRKELASLILMKRIHPKEFQAIHVKEGEPVVHPSSSEIGFYSAVLYNAQTMEMIRREDVGILVRTKDASSFEGGVSAGFAVLNSPIIVWCVCCSQSQIPAFAASSLHFCIHVRETAERRDCGRAEVRQDM